MQSLRREFSAKLDRTQEDRIIKLVQRLIALLDENPDHSDEQRITHRYSRFVQHILDAHLADLESRRGKAAADGIPATPLCAEKAPEAARIDTADTQTPATPLGQVMPNAWDELFPNQSFGPTSPLMAMTDADYMSMLSLPDDDSTMWFNNNFNGRF